MRMKRSSAADTSDFASAGADDAAAAAASAMTMVRRLGVCADSVLIQAWQ
jgi:hypothetical protein